MKAALEAWGAGSNLFHQGVAKESSDPEVIAATMSKPEVVLRRPVGSDAPFSEHPDLPTQLADDEPRHRPGKCKRPGIFAPCAFWATGGAGRLRAAYLSGGAASPARTPC